MRQPRSSVYSFECHTLPLKDNFLTKTTLLPILKPRFTKSSFCSTLGSEGRATTTPEPSNPNRYGIDETGYVPDLSETASEIPNRIDRKGLRWSYLM